MDLDTLSNISCITEKANVLDSKKDELSSWSETSKLWLNYQRMIKVAMKLIKANRTGSWQMHLDAILEALPIFAAGGHSKFLESSYLYLQKMKSLEKQHLKVFHKFMNGFHVIKHTNQYWAGLGSDLVIEQTLMRSLKSTSALIRGSGMTEHQRARWTMCAPISAAYNYAVKDFTNAVITRSEKHKEATPSRMERDRTDMAKLATKLEKHSPFSEGKALQNIITQINTDTDVNVQDLFSAGKETVTQMEGQAIFFLHLQTEG